MGSPLVSSLAYPRAIAKPTRDSPSQGVKSSQGVRRARGQIGGSPSRTAALGTSCGRGSPFLVVMHITRDMHVLDHNQPAAHHLVEHREQAIDRFGSIHDLDRHPIANVKGPL